MIASILLVTGFVAIFGLGYGIGTSLATCKLEQELSRLRADLDRERCDHHKATEQHRKDIENTITVTKFFYAKKRTAAEHMHGRN